MLTWALCLLFSVFVYSEKTFKVVVVDSDAGDLYTTVRQAALDVLKKNGYADKKNLQIFYASVGNDAVKAEGILQELVKNKPDVVFVNGTAVAVAAKKLYLGNKDLKFVYATVTDAVGVGIVNKVGDPANANFVGVSYPVPVKSRLQFIKAIIPTAKKLGLIYAEMPQSESYKKWLLEALKDPAFKGIEIIFRSVPLIKGEDGPQRMAQEAKKHVLELNKVVDVFVSPNDQMGVSAPFPKAVFEVATKPLIGIGQKDVMSGWGATASIFPSHPSLGKQAGEMMVKLFKGTTINQIRSEWVKETGVAFDLKKAQKFGIKIPDNLIKLAKENIIK